MHMSMSGMAGIFAGYYYILGIYADLAHMWQAYNKYRSWHTCGIFHIEPYQSTHVLYNIYIQ